MPCKHFAEHGPHELTGLRDQNPLAVKCSGHSVSLSE
jgi:hypothetical protein